MQGDKTKAEENFQALVLALEHGGIVPIAAIEELMLRVAVERLGVHKAGQVLGLGKTTVYRRMKSWRLTPYRRSPTLETVLFPLESMRDLLVQARRSADYLMRTVGNHGPELGRELDRAVLLFEGARVMVAAVGRK